MPLSSSIPTSLRSRAVASTAIALVLAASIVDPVLAQTNDPGDSSPTGIESGVAEVVVTDTADTEKEGTAESGYRHQTGQVGPLGKRALRDTPYSLNVTSGELIENSNAHTVADALKTNPTATMLMSPGGYSTMSRMMVRGFNAADQNEFRDGLVDRSFSFVPLENVERIEVLNGFSGFLTGFGAQGGTVNYVSKKPTDTPLASLSSGVYGGAIAFGHADLGGRVASTGNRLGYRLNAYHEDGETYIENSSQQRSLFSLALDYRLAPDTKVWADIWHQKYRATGLQTYINPSNIATMGVPDASKFDPTKQYGQGWTYNKAEKTLAGVGVDSKLNDTFSTRIGYRHGFMWRDYATVSDVLTSETTYQQYYTRSARQYEVTNSAYAMLDAKVDTLGIQHDLTAGYNGTKYYFIRGLDVRRGPGVTSNGLLLGTSTLDSTSVFGDPNLSAGGKTQYNPSRMDNYLLGDVIKFNEYVSVLAGITHARVSSQTMGWGTSGTVSATQTVNSRSTQSADTPSLAVMVKPIPSVTTYASYNESLEVGGTAGSTYTYNGTTRAVGNAGQTLAAMVSKQYEVGVKNELGRMDLATALFRIEKTNQYTDPTDSIYKQDGLQVHQGIEFTATGKITDSLTFIGGFTWLDARIVNAASNPLSEGKSPINVPDWQGRAYLEYALPFVPDLTLTGGANYYGRRPIDTANTKFIHEVATVDLGMRFTPDIEGHPVVANLGVTNLFDTAYWAYYRDGEGLLLGQPRLLSLSVKATW
ncbi:TonB-dependent receptor [Magnetospirillum fulvum]|uniref:Iron complex outermembrane recepter protein n=1 Tax=Magnetospirillum fulvum TaxID=1082 RepID=A0A1H6ITX7_MAGFU|nr:TonB-dependent receptor [Magnetospirillum fulvum]SEH51156.1 iron complex outermembrane recepter protein [Magnetospirillum fulvum]